MRIQGLILTILLGACGCQRDTVIHLSGQPSDQSCAALSETDNKKLKPDVAQYFLSEVGVEVKELTLHRGSQCEDAAIFLIVVNEMPPRPFFVKVDRRTGNMSLGRPE